MTHIYASDGLYQVRIFGAFRKILIGVGKNTGEIDLGAQLEVVASGELDIKGN